MRKLNVMLLVAVLVVSSITSASTSIEPTKSENNLTKEIGQLLEKPFFSVENQLEAFVTFTLNEKNEIVVLSVDSDSDLVDEFIKSRLNYKKVAAKGDPDIKFYKMPVRVVGE